MLIFVLNRVEKLEPALTKLEHAGLRGATVLSSRGMAMTLDKYCDGSFLGSLRAMMEPDREENRTVFMVLKDEDVERAVAAVEEVAGSFNTPNSGIAFTLPVDFVKGIQEGQPLRTLWCERQWNWVRFLTLRSCCSAA